MPFKNLEDKKRYNKLYYWKNRKKLKAYRKLRKEQDKKIWQKWWTKKKDKIRKEKINLGQIYKSKSIYR